MENTLQAYKCRECGRCSMIAQGFCFTCRKKDTLERINVEGVGIVFSFTTIHIAEERLQEETPYVVAVVECAGELRVIGRVRSEDLAKVSIGSKVEVVDWLEGTPIFKVSK